jgi:hypothetical protein
VYSERLTLTFEFASAEEYTQFHKDVSPPIHAMLADFLMLSSHDGTKCIKLAT